MPQPLSADAPLPLTVEQLWIYPIKSCAGIRMSSVELLDTGLEWDRTWMVVDESGEFVSQRELPRMALIRPRFRLGQLELRAPGMLSLHLALDEAHAPCRVRVWDDEVDAFDMGDVAAQWFTDCLGSLQAPGIGQRLRLVRFDPDVRRLSAPVWTGGLEAPNQFSDGFPLLVMSSASLNDLNRRLGLLGQGPVGIERFRPNVVLGGLEAHDEDRLAEIRLYAQGLDRPEAPHARLRPVKPCARCGIPDVDPDTALVGHGVGQALQAYRRDRRLMGAITFGMNAVVTHGTGQMLHEGMAGDGLWGAW